MRAAIVVIFALLVAVAGVAEAQPSEADKKEAKREFAAAEAAEARKDWRGAIEHYQRSYDLVPHPFTLFNIALDFERLEEYRDAATWYRRYLDESPEAADRAKVEKLITQLRGRPGQVTIRAVPDDATIEIDGAARGRGSITVALSGAHEITVRSDSGSTSRDIVVEFGEAQTVQLAIAAKAGVLVVTSNVVGAAVFVDGEQVGVTPLSVALPAGPHRMQVVMEGWSTYERPIAIPAEGSTQVTANLARPLGFVAPVEATAEASRTYLQVAGGADAQGEGAIYSVLFGVHRGLFDAGLGYGFVAGGAAFMIDGKLHLTRGKVRPYLRVSLALGGTVSWVAGHAGLTFEVKRQGRVATAVFLDGAAGLARDGTGTTEEDRFLIVPITAGVQLSY